MSVVYVFVCVSDVIRLIFSRTGGLAVRIARYQNEELTSSESLVNGDS